MVQGREPGKSFVNKKLTYETTDSLTQSVTKLGYFEYCLKMFNILHLEWRSSLRGLFRLSMVIQMIDLG